MRTRFRTGWSKGAQFPLARQDVGSFELTRSEVLLNIASRMSKPKSPPPTSRVPALGLSGDDAAHHFAKLGEDYLQAAKMLNDGFKGAAQ